MDDGWEMRLYANCERDEWRPALSINAVYTASKAAGTMKCVPFDALAKQHPTWNTGWTSGAILANGDEEGDSLVV